MDDDIDSNLIHTANEANEQDDLVYTIEQYKWDIEKRNYVKIGVVIPDVVDDVVDVTGISNVKDINIAKG